jgi:hypothetical protein
MNLFPLLSGAGAAGGAAGAASRPLASTAARTVTAALRHLAATRVLADRRRGTTPRASRARPQPPAPQAESRSLLPT